jgi:beta-lactamase regulating signal transducer with metallopeptidase domain
MIELLLRIAPDVLAFLGVSVVLAGCGLFGMRCCRKRSAATRHAIGMVAVVLILVSPFCRRLLPDWGGFSASEMTAPTAGTLVELPVSITENPVDAISGLNVVKQPSLQEAAGTSRTPSGLQGRAKNEVHRENGLTAAPTSKIGTPKDTDTTVGRQDGQLNPWREHDFQQSQTLHGMDSMLPGAASLVSLWLVGFTVGVLLIGLSILRLFWSVRRGEDQHSDEALVTTVSHLARELGVDPINVQISGDATMPSVWGSGIPWLVLPKTAHEWSTERLQMVLAHELAHVKRGDWFWLLLLRLAQATCWINPLIWLLGRRILIECERACDDRVVTEGVGSTEYSRALLEIVTAAHAPVSATAIPMAHFNDLDERIRSVLDLTHSRTGASRMALAVTVLVLVAVVVPVTTVRALTRDELPPFRPIRNFADGSYVELVAIGFDPTDLHNKPTWWTGDGAIINGDFLSDANNEFTIHPKAKRESSSRVMFALRPVVPSQLPEESPHMHCQAEPSLMAGMNRSDSRLQFGWATFEPGQTRITLKVGLAGRDEASWHSRGESAKYKWVEFPNVPLRPDRSAPVVANPLETFRPIEVRPNSETAVHDVDGRFVRDEPERFLTGYDYFSEKPNRRYQLRCELPDSISDLTLLGAWIRDGRTDRILKGISGAREFDIDGHHQFVADMHIPERLEIGYFPRSIEEVDIELRYLSGSMKPGRLTFKGPFDSGSEFASTTQSGTLRVEKHGDSGVQLFIDSKLPFDERHVCLYDRDGQRILKSFSGKSGSGGLSLREPLWEHHLSIKRIVAITVAEPVRVTRIRRIKVADATPVSVDLDIIRQAQAFGMSLDGDLDAKFVQNVRNHQLTSLEEVVRAMPVLRESHLIVRASQILVHDVRDPEKLTEEQQRQVLSVCGQWRRAYSPQIRSCGIQLGLWLKTEDVVDEAITVIAQEDPHSDWGKVAHMLVKRRQRLSDEQLESIAALMVSTSRWHSRGNLFRCLEQTERAVCVRILERFAEADEPWLWWPAVRKLAPLRWKNHPVWKEQFRQREMLSNGSYSLKTKPDHEVLWKEHAAELLSLELYRNDYGIWAKALGMTDRFLDAETATPIVIEFLRDLLDDWGVGNVPGYSQSDWGAVDQCVRYLNHWHGLKIAGLSSSVQFPSEEHGHDWQAIAREAIVWHENLVETRQGSGSAKSVEER